MHPVTLSGPWLPESRQGLPESRWTDTRCRCIEIPVIAIPTNQQLMIDFTITRNFKTINDLDGKRPKSVKRLSRFRQPVCPLS